MSRSAEGVWSLKDVLVGKERLMRDAKEVGKAGEEELRSGSEKGKGGWGGRWW